MRSNRLSQSVPQLVACLRVVLVVGLLAYVFSALRTYWPYITTATLIEDDVAQHLTPYCALRAPEQFRDGFLVDYSKAYLPLGYAALCRMASPFLEPLLFTKLLGLLLLLVSWLLVFLTGRRLAGLIGGVAACLLAVHCHFIFSVTFSGLFRSFGYPLLFLFIYFWVSRRVLWAAGALLLQALFYPPVFLLSAAAFAAEYIRTPRACCLVPARRRAVLGYMAACILGVGALALMSAKPEGYGAAVTREEASQMPEWQRPHGRFRTMPLLSPGLEVYDSYRRGLHGARSGYRAWPWLERTNLERRDPFARLWLLVLLPCALLAWRRAYWLGGLMVGSLGFYALARHAAFALGWPDRFIQYCLPIVPIFLFPLAWCGIGRLSRLWRRLARGVLCTMLLGVCLVYRSGAGYTRRLTLDASSCAPMFSWMRAQPEPMLLAGWPRELLDFAPVYAGKEVLIDYEHMQPVYLGYYARAMERMVDDLELTFATDLATVAGIRDRYGLTHAVLRRDLYDLRMDTPRLYPPLNDLASGLRRRVPSADMFVFRNPPEAWRVYEDKAFIVVDLDRIVVESISERE